MVEADQIFDLWNILSNEIIGDVWLTVFVFTAFIIYLTIKFKMPFELQIMFIILILAALYSQTLMAIIWVFIVLIAGLIFYWTVSKLLN